MAGEATGRTAVPRDSIGGESSRTAVPRITEIGRGRGTPQKRQMPFARHMSIHILQGTGGVDEFDTAGAITNLLTAFTDWKKLPANSHYRILETRFEFVTENKLVMYIIYSE